MFVIFSSTKLFSQQLNRLQIVDDLPLALPLYLLSLDVIFRILSQFLFFGNSFRNLFISQTSLVLLNVWFIISFIVTAWKASKYVFFFWSVFICIRTEYGDLRDLLRDRIESEYRKIRTRKNSIFRHLTQCLRTNMLPYILESTSIILKLKNIFVFMFERAVSNVKKDSIWIFTITCLFPNLEISKLL